MGDLIELNRKNANLTVEETLALAEREEFDDVLVIGLKKGEGISIWVSEMPNERALWLSAKASDTILRHT